MKGDVEFRNVHFSYSSRQDVPVLQDFNLIVPANTTTALVGASGGGKTTVVSLLQRFYDVNSGFNHCRRERHSLVGLTSGYASTLGLCNKSHSSLVCL